jgi:hypothetical protein
MEGIDELTFRCAETGKLVTAECHQSPEGQQKVDVDNCPSCHGQHRGIVVKDSKAVFI